MADTHFEIEEWIPDENAIGGKGYYTAINHYTGVPYREEQEDKARIIYDCIKDEGRKVRLVKVTREVVAQAG